MAKTTAQKIKDSIKQYNMENHKSQISFTCSPGLKKRFTEHCDKNMLNKSKFLEKLMMDFFERLDFEGMEKRV